jgi:hypothetical protein
VFTLFINKAGIFLENLVLSGAGCMLKFKDSFGIEEMIFAVTPPLVLSTPLEIRLFTCLSEKALW